MLSFSVYTIIELKFLNCNQLLINACRARWQISTMRFCISTKQHGVLFFRVTANKEVSPSTLSPFLPFLFEPLVSPYLVHLTTLGTGLLEARKNCKTPCAKYRTLSSRVININQGLLFILKCTLTGIIKFVLLVMTAKLINLPTYLVSLHVKSVFDFSYCCLYRLIWR